MGLFKSIGKTFKRVKPLRTLGSALKPVGSFVRKNALTALGTATLGPVGGFLGNRLGNALTGGGSPVAPPVGFGDASQFDGNQFAGGAFDNFQNILKDVFAPKNNSSTTGQNGQNSSGNKNNTHTNSSVNNSNGSSNLLDRLVDWILSLFK